MTVSSQRRVDEKTAVLQRMLVELGDRDAATLSFGEEDPWFGEVLQTTWRELLDDNLVDDKWSTMGRTRFRLTVHGWLRAISASSMIEETEFRNRCSQLAAALKGVVKGRNSHRDQFASPTEVANQIGVPEGWVMNAIQGRLLGVVFPKSRWDATYSKGLIRVSPTFGLSHTEGGE